jgi:3-oxoacyl-[acyl-carrier protein] reductase
MADLTGKVALVTGGARHLGAGIALGLAERGCHVAIQYRTSAKEARALADRIAGMGSRSLAVRADVTRPDHVHRVVQQVLEGLGGLDIAVHCVGDYLRGTLDETPPEAWRASMDSNLTSAYLVTREAGRVMAARGWGRIVHLGFAGTSQFRARPGLTAYTAAKAALVSMTRSYALEVASRGVTANVVNLGYFEHEDTPAAQKKREAARVPVGRLGTVDDLVRLVAYLASDGAGYLTGNALELSGGFGI